MARPKKPDDQKRATDARIPLLTAEKELLRQATEVAGGDFTDWARPLLLKEAQRIVDGKKGKRNDRK
jgi:hypothetical protein